jgi:hypothetical protein
MFQEVKKECERKVNISWKCSVNVGKHVTKISDSGFLK